MSIATIIGTIVVGGVAFGVIGYFGFYTFKPLYNKIKLSNEIPRARTFLKQLDARFPPGKLSSVQREEREKAMIDAGFTPQSIMIAQTTKPSEVEEVVEWFQKAIEENGMTMFQAEELLIKHGWNQKTISKAKKKLFKLNKKGVLNVREKRKIPELNRAGDNTGESAGDGSRNRDGEVEHKRILPVSTVEPIERDKQKSGWNWEDFK